MDKGQRGVAPLPALRRERGANPPRGRAHLAAARGGAAQSEAPACPRCGRRLGLLADCSLLLTFLPQFLDQRFGLFRREILVVDVVDHHHRRVVAGREALLLLLEEEASVRRALADLDAEPLLDVREDLLAAVAAAGEDASSKE